MTLPYKDEILLDDPIAYWRLGNSFDNTAVNLGSIGNLADGIYSGHPISIEGLIGDNDGAIDFDGNSGVLIADHSSINTASSYSQKTIELTFKADTVSGTQILYEQGGGGNGLNIYLEGNILKFGVWASNSGEWLSYEIDANETYQVALVFDAGQLTGYVNGQVIDSVTTSFTAIPRHTGNIAIGQVNDDTRFSNTSSTSANSGYYFDGMIDDVVLYNTALSEDRISAHYDASDLAPQTLFGTNYIDNLVGGAGNDTLYAYSGNDSLNGKGGNDILFGGYGNDTLTGGIGNDSLSGGNNNDLIAGNAGQNTLTGGSGFDTFIFSEAVDALDTITDFNGDRILITSGFKVGEIEATSLNQL